MIDPPVGGIYIKRMNGARGVPRAGSKEQDFVDRARGAF